MKISVIFGTRPEAIKLAPVILGLRITPGMECRVCVTAQHREMLDQVLQVFEIAPDVDLDIMRPNQGLASLAARAIESIDDYLAKERPELVLVQGDTTTTFAAALAAFYRDIPIGHIEAGLRTGNLRSPWPEEGNRLLTSRLAKFHFAPTERNRANLIAEGVPRDNIFVTGNTVIDALFLSLQKVISNPPPVEGIDPAFLDPWSQNPLVLITGHRRENFGGGLESVCRAIVELAERFPEASFIYPVHLNPNVRSTVMRMLGNGGGDKTISSNIHLIDPLSYLPFVALMKRAWVILTDSGGVQEEAPSLGKPVLVMRDTTERPEAVESGTVRLIGTDCERIVRETALLLTDKAAYEAMSRAHNPYGDGRAAERIIEILARYESRVHPNLAESRVS
ncbi:MAG: UDP-N-acetylglucosamine 2-epimerase (non-hydrolyzing) [Deltaproteobacteria bacterium HGW-Deltaproteobacteria-21]|nr:MAG: UDP-N-acetylglucosamine 2-epimerase (non-hydrolyzing) [Deltaproteobacteria bacterium HGW-Deltaproteobacteria-21]